MKLPQFRINFVSRPRLYQKNMTMKFAAFYKNKTNFSSYFSKMAQFLQKFIIKNICTNICTYIIHKSLYSFLFLKLLTQFAILPKICLNLFF